MTEQRRYELAQVNVARPNAPLDHPILADFMANLEPINALADRADGFVWRLQDGADATSIRIFGDDWMMVNMSVWTSPATLLAFTYSDAHRAMLRRRREWFARLAEAVTALWWVPAGHRPTVAEAEERLTRLRTHGSSALAFSIREVYPAPDGIGQDPVEHLYQRRPAECDV
jgi:hypothetical protein